MRTSSLTQSPFSQAAAQWLESRKPYISPATYRDYTIYIGTLSKFFGELLINEIDNDLIRTYQKMRMTTVGPVTINHECSIIQQIRKRIGTWHLLAGDYQPLPLSGEEVGRCITDEEEAAFFRVGLSAPQFKVAAWCSLLSVNTTAGPGEMLHMKLSDVDVRDKMTIRINHEGAKNKYRIRTIPLTESALWAARLLLARAKDCGAYLPEHYLVPFPINQHKFDPTRPQQHYYRAFNGILAITGLNFRPYDFRHTAITRLLENPEVSLEVARSIAGHISEAMIRRYFHGRLSAQRSAVVAALERKPPEAVRRMLGRTKHA